MTLLTIFHKFYKAYFLIEYWINLYENIEPKVSYKYYFETNDTLVYYRQAAFAHHNQ